MSFFTVSDLSAGYGGRSVIEKLSFHLEEGCVLGILGANGSGKTTLLKAICGILPHGGSCALEGIPLDGLSPRKLARLCGYIPQRSGISIDISVLDVVLMGFNPQLGLLEAPSPKMKQDALRALELTGLAGMAGKNYLHLSEGQKQLCILARTLASGSRLLLLDEPESSLDFRYRYRMLELLRDWTAKGRRAVLTSLHDPSLALNYCDRLLLLTGPDTCRLLLPGSDSLEKMEKELSLIYGSISLHRCRERNGAERLVMLKEKEEEINAGRDENHICG